MLSISITNTTVTNTITNETTIGYTGHYIFK
jgi:hypothetical protein